MQVLVIYYSLYNQILMVWRDDFNRARPLLREHHGQRFYRMWKYCLHACAASFRSGQTQKLWQIVPTRRGEHPDYRSIRLWTTDTVRAGT